MPTIQELNKAVEESQEAVLKFKEDRKKFDKIINEYKELRDKKFDTQKKQEYAKLKDDIKNLEKQIMEYKAEKEDIENLYFLDKEGFEQLCRFFMNPNPQVDDILSYSRADRGRNYDFKDLLHNVNTVEKAKKRLKPLQKIAKKYNSKWKRITDEREKITDNIKQKNNEILKLRQQKDDLKKQTNPYPSANFGYKIAHSEKVDPDKYLSKIESVNFQVDEPIEDNFKPYLDNTIKICDRIKARFERITDVMNQYIVLINSLIRTDSGDTGRISAIERAMKKLEQGEMTASLKDKQDLAEKLGISKFGKSITQQDVINRADNGTGQIKTSNLTTPNSAFDEGVYWLKTPFKQVRVEVYRDSNIMIYPKSKRVAPTYDVISIKLDSIFKDKGNKEVIEKVIDPIINYLKQTVPVPTSNLRNQDLLDKIISMKAVKVERNFLTDEQKEAAATLCGILMLAESHQFRNPTLGKFERSSIKRVKQLALKGIINPFSVVYANKSGEYINAHDRTSDSPDYSDGGQKQTRQLLRYKEINGDIAVKVQDLPNFIKGNMRIPSKINTDKRIDAYGNHNTIGEYIKIKDLDNTTRYEFFEGDKKQTIREFVEKQMNRNMRDQYKKLNRTPKTRE